MQQHWIENIYVTCCRKVQSKESLISAIHPHSQSQINEQTIGCNWSLQNINMKRLESENLDFGILKIQSVVSYNSECQRKSLKQKPAKGDIYFHNYCNDCMLDCLVRRPINWKSLQIRLFARLLEKDKDLSCTFPHGTDKFLGFIIGLCFKEMKRKRFLTYLFIIKCVDIFLQIPLGLHIP